MILEEMLAQRVAVRPDVRLSGALRRGPTQFRLVLDQRTGQLCEVGPKEYFIISRLDGARSLADIGEEYALHFGRRLDQAAWRSVLGLLRARRLLVDGSGTDSSEPIGTPPRSGDVPSRGAPSRPNLVQGRFSLLAGDSSTFRGLYRMLRLTASRRVVPLALLAIAFMEVQVIRHAGTLLHQASRLTHNLGLLSIVVAALAVSVVLHELEHGVVARRFGATVTELGLIWRLPKVGAYCKADDYLLLPRWQQVATAGAGAYMNLLFLLPFYAASVFVVPSSPAADALAGLLLVGSAIALANLVPLPSLDGYKMLSHSLAMSGYARESFEFVRLAASRVVRRGATIARYPWTARIAYAGYALGSVVVASGATVGLALLLRHLLVNRFGAKSGVLSIVVVVLFVVGTSVNMVTRGRQRGRAVRRSVQES